LAFVSVLSFKNASKVPSLPLLRFCAGEVFCGFWPVSGEGCARVVEDVTCEDAAADMFTRETAKKSESSKESQSVYGKKSFHGARKLLQKKALKS
jgi:hypothetical protein